MKAFTYLLTIIILISGCSKSANPAPPSPLIGTWALTEQSVTGCSSPTYNSDVKYSAPYATITFAANTYTTKSASGKVSNPAPYTEVSGALFFGPDTSSEEYVYSVTSTTLYYYGTPVTSGGTGVLPVPDPHAGCTSHYYYLKQ